MYQSLLCPTCHNQVEDQQHLWTCQARIQILNLIKQNFFDNVIKFAIEYDIKESTAKNLVDQLKQINLSYIFKGLITKNITNLNNGNISRNKWSKITNKIVTNIYKDIYQHIWKKRCEDMVALEQ